ncbi:MAG: hypothetical protein U9N78_08455 [Actinomycetota bacterium]|nr:hypothetical protein [Actinomycetota bacterium]
MSEWGWVAFAYAVAYGSLAAFGGSIAWRIRSARRSIGEIE